MITTQRKCYVYFLTEDYINLRTHVYKNIDDFIRPLHRVIAVYDLRYFQYHIFHIPIFQKHNIILLLRYLLFHFFKFPCDNIKYYLNRNFSTKICTYLPTKQRLKLSH
jgi:hypothetical protein